MNKSERVVTITEAAERCGCTRSNIHYAIKSGEVTQYEITKPNGVLVSEVRRYMRKPKGARGRPRAKAPARKKKGRRR